VSRAPLVLLLLLSRPCSNAPRGTGAAVIIGSMAVYREGERERERERERENVCEEKGGGRGGDGRIHVVHSVTAVQPVRSTRTCSKRRTPSEVMA